MDFYSQPRTDQTFIITLYRFKTISHLNTSKKEKKKSLLTILDTAQSIANTTTEPVSTFTFHQFFFKSLKSHLFQLAYWLCVCVCACECVCVCVCVCTCTLRSLFWLCSGSLLCNGLWTPICKNSTWKCIVLLLPFTTENGTSRQVLCCECLQPQIKTIKSQVYTHV